MSEATSGGIGGGVILLVLLVLLALAVGIWFVLRRRGESPARAWATGPQTPARPVVADVAPVGAAGSSDDVTRPSDQDQAPEGSGYAEGGLSSLSASGTDEAGEPTHRGEPASAEHPEPGGDGDEGGQVSGTAPQTPTQAFGEAEGTSRPDSQDLHSLLFDGPDADADSTPLFRSVRERLLAAVGEPVDSTGSADAAVTDDDVVTAQEDTTQDESGVLTDPDAEVVPDTDSEQEVEGATEAGGVSGTRVRRISELHEVVDGGFGIGSAAVIADGGQPLGHPIKAVLATRTYVDLHSPSYDEVEPDLWFLDAGFAERAGFRHAD